MLLGLFRTCLLMEIFITSAAYIQHIYNSRKNNVRHEFELQQKVQTLFANKDQKGQYGAFNIRLHILVGNVSIYQNIFAVDTLLSSQNLCLRSLLH